MADTVIEEIKVENKDEVLEELTKIEKTHGVIRPVDVVSAARDENSLLHKFFQWDDNVAAEQYRKMQARQLINSVRVEFLPNQTREAFLNVTTTVKNVPMRGYVSTAKVLSDEALRKQILGQALHEIAYWQDKYKTLDEADEIVNREKVEKLSQELDD